MRKAFINRPGPLGLSPPDIEDPKKKIHYWNWWELYIWSSIRRVIESGRSGVTTVGVGVATASVTVVIALAQFTSGALFLASVSTAFVASSYFLFVSICWAAYTGLRAQTPQDYAETVLAGKTAPDILKALAYEMRAVCRVFENQSIRLSAHVKELDRLIKELEKELRSAAPQIRSKASIQRISETVNRLHDIVSRVRDKEVVEEYEKDSAASDESLQRLFALKARASRILAIPERRLCDHVLQYSPTTHGELVEQYHDLWKRLLHEIDRLSDREPNVDKIQEYLTRCAGISSTVSEGRENLELFFGADDLHAHIHRIASRHSTSGAVEEYARAIGDVAKKGRHSLGLSEVSPVHAREKRRQFKKIDLPQFEGSQSDPRFEALCRTLHLLFRKQKAYPGFEVHNSLLSLCEQACRDSATFGDDVAVDQELLRQLVNCLKSMMKNPDKYDLCDYINADNATRAREASSNLAALQELPIIVNSYLEWSRRRIARLCYHFVASWLEQSNQPGRNSVILTHGYSKTVREVLGTGLAEFQPKDQPLVLVMSSHNMDTDDIRKMMYQVKEKSDSHGPVVGSGDENVLVELLGPGDKILVLLGAECFDKVDRRVVHPRGARKSLMMLRKERDDSGLVVVIVAEQYKNRVLNIESEVEFFRSQLNHLDVYPGTMVDAVISEHTMYANKNYEEVKREALFRHRFMDLYPAFSEADYHKEFGARVAASPSLETMRANHEIFAVSAPSGLRYPAFQFCDNGKPLLACSQVVTIKQKSSGWGIASWFDAPNVKLDGKKPVDLIDEDPEGVARAALDS